MSTKLITPLDPNRAVLLQQEINFGVDALKRGMPDMAITFFQSVMQKIDVSMPFFDHITHNLLLSYKQRIEQLLAANEVGSAKDLLKRALKLEIKGQMAADKLFRRTFADTFQNLGLVFFEYLQMQACVDCCRKAITTQPCPTYYVNLTNALSVLKKAPLISDFRHDLSPDKLGQHIFIACVPKSASTFLKNVLVSLTGYKDLFTVYASGQNEHELYLPTLSEYAETNSVTQQHCRASEANIQLMQAFQIKPVILVRNIYDSVISLLDFYNQGASFNTYFRTDFNSLDEELKIDLIIDNVIPWYFQFVSSWQVVEKENRLPVFWLKYEKLTKDKTNAILEVLKFYGLGASNSNIEKVIRSSESDSRKNRINKGVSGRGNAVLTEVQKVRIKELAKYYPSRNFDLLEF